MKDKYLERQKTLSVHEIKDKTCDFTTKYFAVYHLQCLAQTHPEIIGRETISTLEGLLKNSGFSRQRQGFFLFRLAADTPTSVIVHSKDKSMADQALSALKNILGTTTGHAHRVSAEALGALPFSIHGPDIKGAIIENVPRANWQQILDEKGLKISSPPAFIGRSLVAPLDQGNRLLVFKLALADDSPDSLFREALWMEHLRAESYPFPLRFNIPVAIKIEDTYVFSLKDIPVRASQNIDLHPKGYAIGFIADKGYFTYPNDSRMERRLTDEEFREVMFRNAWLLGKLTSLGIVHSAPIPLFHNRVQRK